MPRGRTFGAESKIYGTAAIASLMEEKPSTEGASECKVYLMDKELFNKTGEVKIVEFLRTEDAPKAQKMVCVKGRCVYEKEG